MSKFKHKVSLTVITLLLIINIGCQKNSAYHPPSKPNVLFILADDLGYHDLSCMGSEYYETPHIDRIAEAGTIFREGYACSRVCSPSRASIMSGKNPARHGITDWIGAPSGEDWRRYGRFDRLLPAPYQRHLPHEYTVLPEAFLANGYRTFFAGKWHLGNEGSYPEDHGFEVNVGGYERGGPYSGGFFSPFNNPKMEDYDDEKGMSLSMKLAKETGKFIEANKDEPFVAYLSFYAVHSPIQTTQGRWEKYRLKALERGVQDDGFVMERKLPIRRFQDNPIYAGLIEQMDNGVGHVLDILEQLNLTENTIVVFTSDNGGVASGDNFSTSNRPLRGGKGYQWEGGLKVPYLVSVPWIPSQPKTVDDPVSGVDFYPSLLDLCGLKAMPEEHLDGHSFVPALVDKMGRDRPLIWHYPHYGNQGGDPSSVIRLGDWKMIQYYDYDKRELYHLKEDPGEENDLFEAHPDIVEDLTTKLNQYLSDVGASFPAKDEFFDKDSSEMRMRYYEGDLHDRLESQRQLYYQSDWQPNEDWWGSEVELD